MELSGSVREIMEIERCLARDRETFIELNIRKDAPAQSTPAFYEPLPKEQWDEHLQAWNAFHENFSYDSFREFYSKAEFCLWLQYEQLPKDREKAKELFLRLLADRKFLFLEYSEHLNAPDYPSMSEIVRNPNRYLKRLKLPEQPDATQKADDRMRQNARIVWEQGFVPTDAHAAAHRQMTKNFEALTEAIQQRERFRTKERNLQQPLNTLYKTVCIRFRPLERQYSELEKKLGRLFQVYLTSTAENAYAPKFQKLSEELRDNHLPAIHEILALLESQKLMPYSALVLFHLFTQNTTKLAQGRLRAYQFAPLRRRSVRGSPQNDQEITRRRTEHKIMLFDHLLRLLPPEDPNFLKYLFHKYTQYNGYFHFDLTPCQENDWFSCLPNPCDSVDQLGGEFRRHIRFCIPNDVGWLTPGIPNDRTGNSEALATFLLQDAAYLPVYTRLTDRVRRLLKDSALRDKMISEYQAAYLSQKRTIALLKKWCSQYGLEFIRAESSLDLRQRHSESLNQLCSRFVLEHALKESIYDDARENLAQIAKLLFGDLCIGEETFQLL